VAYQVKFAAEVDPKWAELRRLKRMLDRQRRSCNPDHYLSDGRIKPGVKRWRRSKRMRRTEAKIALVYARAAAHRKTLHGRMINELLSLGDVFYLETLSYRAWQRLWGRSVGVRAPGSFVASLERKAASAAARVEGLNPWKTALSQVCVCGRKKKKALRERIHACPECGVRVGRDLLSAYLACFVVEGEDLDADRARGAWSGVEALLQTASGKDQGASGGGTTTLLPVRATAPGQSPSSDWGGVGLAAPGEGQGEASCGRALLHEESPADSGALLPARTEPAAAQAVEGVEEETRTTGRQPW
jgi:hypothetical protein